MIRGQISIIFGVLEISKHLLSSAHEFGTNLSGQTASPRNEQKMMTADKVAKNIICAIDCKKDTLILSRNGKLAVWLNRFFPNLAKRLVFDHFKKEKRFQK